MSSTSFLRTRRSLYSNSTTLCANIRHATPGRVPDRTRATRYYSSKTPSPSSAARPAPQPSRKARKVWAAKPPPVSTSGTAESIDSSAAFTPSPFSIPGSPAFGGNSLRDAALTTVVGLGLVFVGGVGYMKWYKWNVLRKIEDAFAPGYDPALELATYQSRPKSGTAPRLEDEAVDEAPELDAPAQLLRRREQDAIDAIVHGDEPGHYFVLLGPKGSGKGTMILNAMTACKADGVAMLDAHPDLEVFRLKLGKAINYEYNEDSQTGLFQRRDPREGGPALDIERALNKLEKVALRVAHARGKPLVLIVNNVHFFKNDDDGRAMLLQLQQRAESWAASGVLTCVFMTDDYWPFYVMRKTASRMHVVTIGDLDEQHSIQAATNMYQTLRKRQPSSAVVEEAVSVVGGRLSYLNKVARSKDMVEAAQNLLQIEKAWLRSQIGLIPDCDDDVMDEQKWSSCSWLLLREFVKLRKEQEAARDEAIAAGDHDPADLHLPLPTIPYYKCREIMTRADFMEDLDRANIISVDIHHDVRPDSMLILHAARQVCEEDGFDELLDNVRDRIDEIESLHRTRELTFKDASRINLSVDKTDTRIVDE